MPVRGNRAGDREASAAAKRALTPLQRALSGLLWLYQSFVSPALPSACRFYPTCSEYMRQAVVRRGAWLGLWLGVKRLAKCHPFHPGGVDMVP